MDSYKSFGTCFLSKLQLVGYLSSSEVGVCFLIELSMV
jgi:hypothetical protein